MLSQGHMGAPIYRYTNQVGPIFGKSGSLEEWKWWTSRLRLISTSGLLHTSILDRSKVFRANGMLSKGNMGAPVYHYTSQVGPRFRRSGSLVEWNWCHNIMIEADILVPFITIVSCECQSSSSLPRGTSSPCPNMAYWPPVPQKASCQGFTNRMPLS